MKYSNIDILTAVLVTWIKPMVDTIFASRIGKFQPIIAANEWVKKYFPVSEKYSIVNDLSFLATPAMNIMLKPTIKNAVTKLGLDDAGIPAYAHQLVDALIEEADTKGKVTIFNAIEFEKEDFEKLRYLLNKNLPVESTEEYQVKV